MENKDKKKIVIIGAGKSAEIMAKAIKLANKNDIMILGVGSDEKDLKTLGFENGSLEELLSKKIEETRKDIDKLRVENIKDIPISLGTIEPYFDEKPRKRDKYKKKFHK